MKLGDFIIPDNLADKKEIIAMVISAIELQRRVAVVGKIHSAIPYLLYEQAESCYRNVRELLLELGGTERDAADWWKEKE